MTIADTELRARQRMHRSPPSLPDLASHHILAAILGGEYAPGARLNTARFAQELRMSLNPIREAIIRLREIGVVEVTPARYTKVADFTAAETRAAIRYAGVLAGTAVMQTLPDAAEGVRSDLVARVEAIGSADGTAGRNAAVIGFLSGAADIIMEHPRQAMHLVEATILAQCALRSSEAASGADPTPVRSAADAVARALRAGDPDATEKAVRILFLHLA